MEATQSHEPVDLAADRRLELATPESVALALPLAGLASRMAALFARRRWMAIRASTVIATQSTPDELRKGTQVCHTAS